MVNSWKFQKRRWNASSKAANTWLSWKNQTPAETVAELVEPESQLTDREIYRQARQQSREKAGPEQLVCSRLRRFLGRLIDSVALMGASVVGAVIAFLISPPVPEQLNLGFLAILLVPSLMLAFVQWSMTALDGRTLGKYCVNTQVVNLQGEAPGWLQGVILRSWLIGLLNMVPFFGLLDAAWIFSNESNRCLHDLIAGTYVIEAS